MSKDLIRKIFFILLLSANFLMAALVFTPLTNRLFALLEVERDIRHADAIILLCAETYSEDVVGREAYQRIFDALRLYKNKYARRIVICGGKNRIDLPPGSLVMKNLLTLAGVHEKDILIETTSRNTFENLRNAREILRRENIKKSLLVTSSYHMRRAVAVSRKLGIQVYPAPVPCFEKTITHWGLRYRFIREVLREFGAIVYFRLRGWI